MDADGPQSAKKKTNGLMGTTNVVKPAIKKFKKKKFFKGNF